MGGTAATTQPSTVAPAASTQAPPPPSFFASPHTSTARAAEAAVPAGGDTQPMQGVQTCNIIEAPWLVNGGHSASFGGDTQPMQGVQTCNGGDAMLLLLLEASAELSGAPGVSILKAVHFD
jgi:hypothetical protein